MPAQEWLYARIHHRNHADGELLLTTLVPSWLHEAGRLGIRRWFFVRYADLSGPHLRLRFRGAPGALDDCYAAGRRLWVEHARRPPAQEAVERLHPMAEAAIPGSGQRRLSFGLYGREYDYYGAPAAVDIAEELFQQSSEVSLEAVARTAGDRAARARIAVDVMRGCLGDLGTAQRERFWRLHWQHWTGPLSGAPALMVQAEKTAARWRRRLGEDACAAATAPGAAGLSAAATALGRALAEGVSRAMRADPGAVASRLLLMQVHMTLNRLGFLPLEEAVLGRAAAQAPSTPAPRGGPQDPVRILRSAPGPLAGRTTLTEGISR
ncbi:thiopeptide-type bacteriocin biosynthesis protein [Streptomyces sp. NPDC051776]|uniref:thiopeptide-type bacteriocin biosynthesis protein n=1 Tax=Streptomyces sp. NPDC051776 TaxID=3155414 RepID=UPI00341A4A00